MVDIEKIRKSATKSLEKDCYGDISVTDAVFSALRKEKYKNEQFTYKHRDLLSVYGLIKELEKEYH